jgi:hypothetical protein
MFLLHQQENASISAIAKAKDVVHHKQPFLIVVGSLEHPMSFNLIFDFTVIALAAIAQGHSTSSSPLFLCLDWNSQNT